MTKQSEKVNKIFDKYKDKFEGMLHNDLWQIVINERFENERVAFVYIPVDGTVGAAILNEPGYLPLNFVFKHEVPVDQRRTILKELNKDVFELTEEQADEVEISSYRKPMEKAKGNPPPPPSPVLVIHEYGAAVGKILTRGNSVLVALQIRLPGSDNFHTPVIHRVASTNHARLIAQYHANITEREVRATFPDEDVLKTGERPWVDYVGALNGEYFRPKKPSEYN